MTPSVIDFPSQVQREQREHHEPNDESNDSSDDDREVVHAEIDDHLSTFPIAKSATAGS